MLKRIKAETLTKWMNMNLGLRRQFQRGDINMGVIIIKCYLKYKSWDLMNIEKTRN